MTKSEFLSLAQDVTKATAYRYGLRDHLGNTMDGVKVLADPAGGYLAVYHTLLGGFFYAKLATSTDLMNWTFQRDLAGARTAMPALLLLRNNGFVLACEKGDATGKIWLHFDYFGNRADLFAGVVSRQFDAPTQLSTTSVKAEGTPNFYSAQLHSNIDASTIEVGFHYFKAGSPAVDREGFGVLTNFNSWTSNSVPALDNALVALGCHGNIGDRDPVRFKDGYYNLIEGQQTAGNWATWHVYLWDLASNTAGPLNIVTHAGSTAFGNPSVTNLTAPNGRRALVFGDFLFGEGAAPGEGGSLLYYRQFGSVDLAKNKTFTASSQFSAAYGPALAGDGNENTRWASATSGNPEWLQVDLGSVRPINTVVTRWEVAYASNYTISVSKDGATWTPVVTATGRNGEPTSDAFADVFARYVRMNCNTNGIGLLLYSIWSFEVYDQRIDSNGDGISDDWAAQFGFNPTGPSIANADPDGDGMNNLAEFLAGTVPTNPNSRLAVSDFRKDAGTFPRVTWRSTGGRTYSVQYANDLLSGFAEALQTVESSVPDGVETTRLFVDDFSQTGGTPPLGKRFYRVRLIPPN